MSLWTVTSSFLAIKPKVEVVGNITNFLLPI